jgi:hypothetical protein
VARIRTIKPEIAHDVKLAACSRDARLLFFLMITQADDKGRLHGALGAVRGACLPLDDVTLADIDGWMDELAAQGLIQRYVVSENRYVQLRGWDKHQIVHKPNKFHLPDPPNSRDFKGSPGDPHGDPTGIPRPDLGPSTTDQGPTTKDQGPMTKDQKNFSSGVFDADTTQECDHLAGWIVKNGGKRPTITTKWLRDMERLKRLDGRTHEQVMAAIDWCQQDDFWRANILSPEKLRKQYDRLRLQAARDRPPTGSEVRAAIARGEA